VIVLFDDRVELISAGGFHDGYWLLTFDGSV